jgi:hypothetical protein
MRKVDKLIIDVMKGKLTEGELVNLLKEELVKLG